MSKLSWEIIFSGWAPIWRTLILGTFAYLAIVVMLRISGKRTLSKMNAFDFVVTVALGSTLASILTSATVSLVQGVIAFGLLILLQLVNTFLAVRSASYNRLIKAQPALLFFKGNFLMDALRAERVTKDEVLAAMRGQGFTEPGEVDAVVMETEGTLAVLKGDAATLEKLSQLGVNVERPIGAKTPFST